MLLSWLNILAGGVLIGIVYALIGSGLTIMFGVMRVVNFAHGEMVVAGMYMGYFAHSLLGLPAPLAAIIAAVVMFAFGYLLQRLLVEKFMARPQHIQFILFIGIALVITGLHLAVFGPDAHAVDGPITFATISLGPLSLDLVRVQAAGGAAVLILSLVLFLRLAPLGQAMRAAADSRTGSLVIGMNVPRICALASGIGAACAGAAGALISPVFDTEPYLGLEFTLIAFVTVIVGGLGSLAGALVGGVLIGLAEATAALAIDPQLKTAFSYGLLLLVLLLRPRGLFGADAG